MTIIKNPFIFKELYPNSPFCDRTKELEELISHANGRANVLIYSPRRYGKTSLVRRVQRRLSDKGAVTIFADFFGVTNIDDLSSRLAKAVFEVTHTKESLFRNAIKIIKSFRPILKPDESGGVSLSVETTSVKKTGLDLLEETMSSLGQFIEQTTVLVHVVLDEFQEITELRNDVRRIEGIMRSYIQRQNASYFFVGSRRRILLAMFNERQRPFFQSAINYELKTLPHAELTQFINNQFKTAEKDCPLKLCEEISNVVHQHPYYAQKLAFFVCQISQGVVVEEDIKRGFETLLESEKPVFEAILQGLSVQQIALLKALAEGPGKSVFSIDYMKRYNLGSTGGVQGALKRLSLLDLIEQSKPGWKTVDPIFAVWLIT